MRSISGMPSDDMAGDAKRRVLIHYVGRQMRSISGMPSDDMAGDAKRRVPIQYRLGGHINGKTWWFPGRDARQYG